MAALVVSASGVFTASVGAGGNTTDTSTTGDAAVNFAIGVSYWFEVAGTAVPTGRIGGSSTGVTMIGTKKSFFVDFQHMAWWYILNPGTGALAWDVAYDTAVDDIYTGIISFSGADVAGTPLGTEATFTTGNDGSPTITPAGGNASSISLAWCGSRTPDTARASATWTEAFNIDTGGDRSLVLEYVAGAGQAMNFTQSAEQWGVRGIVVLAPSASGDTQEWRGSSPVPRGRSDGHVVY